MHAGRAAMNGTASAAAARRGSARSLGQWGALCDGERRLP
jgi:hypothetical protein